MDGGGACYHGIQVIVMKALLLLLVGVCGCNESVLTVDGGLDATPHDFSDPPRIPCNKGLCSPTEFCYSMECDSVAHGLGQCAQVGYIEFTCKTMPKECQIDATCACLSVTYGNACNCTEPRRVACLVY